MCKRVTDHRPEIFFNHPELNINRPQILFIHCVKQQDLCLLSNGLLLQISRGAGGFVSKS